jgi:hypothetical protein
MAAEVIHYILVCINIGVRIITVSIAVLLIIRSEAGRFLPLSVQVYLKPLFFFTDAIVIPVSYILPEQVVKRDRDYSPLATALLILLIGLGIEQLLVSINVYVLKGF